MRKQLALAFSLSLLGVATWPTAHAVPRQSPVTDPQRSTVAAQQRASSLDVLRWQQVKQAIIEHVRSDSLNLRITEQGITVNPRLPIAVVTRLALVLPKPYELAVSLADPGDSRHGTLVNVKGEYALARLARSGRSRLRSTALYSYSLRVPGNESAQPIAYAVPGTTVPFDEIVVRRSTSVFRPTAMSGILHWQGKIPAPLKPVVLPPKRASLAQLAPVALINTLANTTTTMTPTGPMPSRPSAMASALVATKPETIGGLPSITTTTPSATPPANVAPASEPSSRAPSSVPSEALSTRTLTSATDLSNAGANNSHPQRAASHAAPDAAPASVSSEVSGDVKTWLPMLEGSLPQLSFATELARREPSTEPAPHATPSNMAIPASTEPAPWVYTTLTNYANFELPLAAGVASLAFLAFLILLIGIVVWQRHRGAARRSENVTADPILLHAVDELAEALHSHGRNIAHLVPIQRRLRRQLHSRAGMATAGRVHAQWLLFDEMKRTGVAIESRGDTRNAKLALRLAARQKKVAMADVALH